MTVLLEGMSLVFANAVLEERCPGGALGFRSVWDNGSFCTDGTISRLSFFESADAFCTLMAMPDYGLEVSTVFAADVGVFLYGRKPWVPCLWLETSCKKDDMWCCWHVNEARSRSMAVPPYFQPSNTLARYGHLDEAEIQAKVTRIGEKEGVSLFRHQPTNRVLAGPSPLRRH